MRVRKRSFSFHTPCHFGSDSFGVVTLGLHCGLDLPPDRYKLGKRGLRPLDVCGLGHDCALGSTPAVAGWMKKWPARCRNSAGMRACTRGEIGPMADQDVIARFEEVRENVARAAHDCGREPGKGHARGRLQDLSRRGRSCPCWKPVIGSFGENYVQETAGKWPACVSASRMSNCT